MAEFRYGAVFTRYPPRTLECRGFGRETHMSSVLIRAGLCADCYAHALKAGQGEYVREEWRQIKAARYE